jgi:hypothetical protein
MEITVVLVFASVACQSQAKQQRVYDAPLHPGRTFFTTSCLHTPLIHKLGKYPTNITHAVFSSKYNE